MKEEVITMGFHVCEYCREATSSGDVRLVFTNGRAYEMPDMILHYVAEHGWQPPAEFVEDVLNGFPAWGNVPGDLTRVGYLSGPFEAGERNPGLVARLQYLMRCAGDYRQRRQTKGLHRVETRGMER